MYGTNILDLVMAGSNNLRLAIEQYTYTTQIRLRPISDLSCDLAPAFWFSPFDSIPSAHTLPHLRLPSVYFFPLSLYWSKHGVSDGLAGFMSTCCMEFTCHVSPVGFRDWDLFNERVRG